MRNQISLRCLQIQEAVLLILTLSYRDSCGVLFRAAKQPQGDQLSEGTSIDVDLELAGIFHYLSVQREDDIADSEVGESSQTS